MDEVKTDSQHSDAQATNAIGVQLPQHLTCASDTYTSSDDALLRQSPSHFFARHRDTPAHFSAPAARHLFSSSQRKQLDTLFAHGWETNASSPLHALIGTCRTSSAHRTQAYDEYAVRDASVGAFVRKAQRGKQLVVSDVQLGKLPPSLVSSLLQGPALFQHANILQVVSQDETAPEQYHCLCYAIFGTGSSLTFFTLWGATWRDLTVSLLFHPSIHSGGSYTAPHVDFFGTDAYLYLVSGEKLWFLAPP